MEDDDTQGALHLGPEEIWEKARDLHEKIYDDVKQPGDAIAIVGVVLTNMLIAGRLAGVPEEFIDHVLKTVKEDIENGVKAAQNETVN
jgi:hypothetical protein